MYALSFNNVNMLNIFTPNCQSMPKQQSQPNTLMPSCPLSSFCLSSSLLWNLGKAYGPHNPWDPPAWVHLKKTWHGRRWIHLSAMASCLVVLKPRNVPCLFACYLPRKKGGAKNPKIIMKHHPLMEAARRHQLHRKLTHHFWRCENPPVFRWVLRHFPTIFRLIHPTNHTRLNMSYELPPMSPENGPF